MLTALLIVSIVPVFVVGALLGSYTERKRSNKLLEELLEKFNGYTADQERALRRFNDYMNEMD